VTEADEAVDALPIHYRRHAETPGERTGVDAFAQAQAHDQGFVGGLGRQQGLLFGDTMTVAT